MRIKSHLTSPLNAAADAVPAALCRLQFIRTYVSFGSLSVSEPAGSRRRRRAVLSHRGG